MFGILGSGAMFRRGITYFFHLPVVGGAQFLRNVATHEPGYPTTIRSCVLLPHIYL